jgi:RND family efflux transporter MFP subunit
MPPSEQVDLSKLKIRREEEAPVSERSRKRYGLLLYGFGVLFLALIGFLFFKDNFGSVEAVEITTVSFVSPNQAGALLTASGYVVAQRKASIASKATGRLVFLGFEEGDNVKKGEIIGRIESSDVEAALTQAKANLAVSKADRNDADQSLDRAKKLFDRHLISQAELDAAQARYDRVVATIAASEAAIKSAEVQLENTLIRAPFDGTILTKNADVGEVVAPFAAGASSRVAVVTIADMSSLEVEADVSESNIEKINPQQSCEVVLDAYPDHRYRGYVNKIVPTADRAKATVMTKIRFVDRDSRVLPEMSAKVYFLSKPNADTVSATPKLAVNPAAITTRRNKKVVFVVKDESVAETLVELGESVGSMIEVKSGLSSGDKVVLKPSENLQHGMKVTLKK